MTTTFDAKDRRFLKSVGIGAEPASDTRLDVKQPEVSSETNQVFSAQEMATRYRRLKAARKVPSLADVLKVIQNRK
jgi:hypothetical protein